MDIHVVMKLFLQLECVFTCFNDIDSYVPIVLVHKIDSGDLLREGFATGST